MARLPSDGKEADGQQSRFPREQQNQTPVPAEPAIPPFLGGVENRWVRLRLTNAGLRTIDKNGIDAVLADLRAQGVKCKEKTMRDKIKLRSTAAPVTSHHQNKEDDAGKMEIMKFDPKAVSTSPTRKPSSSRLRVSGTGKSPALPGFFVLFVIPAKAGIGACQSHWISACAGMTQITRNSSTCRVNCCNCAMPVASAPCTNRPAATSSSFGA